MSNILITNIDIGNVILKNAEFRDELLSFTGAGTIAAGTILARKAVNDIVDATADGGNTGDGTVTSATVFGSTIPMVGNYNLELIEGITNGGIFKLENPNGALVASNLILAVGAGATTTLKVGGLQCIVTDGDADFIVGDKFSLAVVANGKLVPYAINGIGGAQNPKSVLTYDVISSGAGDEPVRAMVNGIVRKQRLIINADGDGSNITAVILDQLRDYGVTAIDVSQLTQIDNQ